MPTDCVLLSANILRGIPCHPTIYEYWRNMWRGSLLVRETPGYFSIYVRNHHYGFPSRCSIWKSAQYFHCDKWNRIANREQSLFLLLVKFSLSNSQLRQSLSVFFHHFTCAASTIADSWRRAYLLSGRLPPLQGSLMLTRWKNRPVPTILTSRLVTPWDLNTRSFRKRTSIHIIRL